MRKFYQSIFILIITGTGMLQAQTGSGNLLIGASTVFYSQANTPSLIHAGYTSRSFKSSSNSFVEPEPDVEKSFSVIPKIGFFIKDNIALNFDVTYIYSSYDSPRFDRSWSEDLVSIGPSIRYYVPVYKVLPYVEIHSAFGRSKFRSSLVAPYKTRITTYGAGIGVAAPISENLTFDFLINYSSITRKRVEDNTHNARSVNSNLGFQIGFTIMLNPVEDENTENN